MFHYFCDGKFIHELRLHTIAQTIPTVVLNKHDSFIYSFHSIRVAIQPTDTEQVTHYA
jgi:hypothetical protein